MTAETNDRVVTGVVHWDTPGDDPGEPAAGVRVRAYDQTLDGPVPLGEAVTGADGTYRIPYPGAEYRAAGSVAPDPMRLLRVEPGVTRPGPDLWVGAAVDGDADLARSATVAAAGPQTAVDLRLPRPAGTEFEQLTTVLAPRVADRSLADLTDDQVDTLGQDAGLPRDQVTAAVTAARAVRDAQNLAGRYQVDLGGLEPVLLSAVYAAARSEPGVAPADLLARDGDWWTTVVRDAAAQSVLPPPEPATLDGLTGLLTTLWQINQVTPGPPGAPTLGTLLETMPPPLRLDDPDRKELAQLLEPGSTNLDALRIRLLDRAWAPAKVNGVLRTIGLGELTAQFPPLVAALQEAEPDDPAARLADLAAYGRDQWTALVTRTGAPDEPQRYVDRLLRNVEQRLPSEYVRARIADGRITPVAATAETVRRFLGNATTFRLGDEPVLERFGAPTAADLDGLSDEEAGAVRTELLRLERVIRVSPDLESAEHVLAAGYHSARQIAGEHRGRFVAGLAATLPGGQETAEQVYERASGVVATATAVLLAHAPAFNRTPGLPVIDAPAPVARMAAAAADPTATLETLFGSQDACSTDGYASMYSPAAYLVDLMHMLDGGVRNDAGQSALDVLFARRPDLAELELTNDNTDVVVPYTDLVLELLESGLAATSPLNAFARGRRRPDGSIEDWGFDADLDDGRMPADLRADMAGFGIDVGDAPIVTAIADPPGKRWRVAGNGWRLHLIGGGNPARLNVALFPQSTPDTPTDGAIPRPYVQWAYGSVSSARHPWTLPFRLEASETGAWLDLLGTSRREIADAYAPATRFEALGNALAVLGLTAADGNRYLQAVADHWVDWGYPADRVVNADGVNVDWYVDLRTVSHLEERGRLTHRELLELLDTRFVATAPGLAAPMVFSGAECDSDAMVLGDFPGGMLTPSVLRRIFLFVRLARQLGWTYADLDAAIAGYGPALDPPIVPMPQATSTEERFTGPFLAHLANLVRLRTLTGLGVPAVVNLFRATLDTRSYYDQSGGVPRSQPSYYERLLDDPAVSRPRAPGLELNAAQTGLVPLPPGDDFPRLRLSDYPGELTAALSCRAGDLAAVLGPAATSVRPIQVGGDAVVGDWVELAPGAVAVEWVVGRPGDAATQIRITVQQRDAADVVSDVGAPVTVGRGAGDWQRVVVAYAGSAVRLRIRAERTAGTATTWFAARVLTGPALVEDSLTLGTLTRLCAHVQLARAARMSTVDYVTLAGLSGITPLASPAAALRLLDAGTRTRAAGLAIADLDTVLRHRYPTAAAAERADLAVAGLLTDTRTRIRTEEADLAGTAENAVPLARRLLLELGWPDRLVDLLLRLLEEPPPGTAETVAAVATLGRSLLLPLHRAPYGRDEDPVVVPASWSGTFWWDPVAASWTFVGPMTQAWHDELAEFGATPAASPYRQAVTTLFDTAAAYHESAGRVLLGGTLTAQDVLKADTAPQRCLLLLDKIVPAVREQRATTIAAQLAADAFDLEPALAAALTGRFRHAEDGDTRPLVDRDRARSWLLDPAFAQSDPAVAVTAAAFPAQFHAVQRLAKLAAIAAAGLRPEETIWLFGGWDSAGRFDLSTLPLAPVAGPAPQWATWFELAGLLGTGPGAGGRRDLENLRVALSTAGDERLRYALAADVLDIPADDLTRIAADLGATGAADLLRPVVTAALIACAQLLRRAGADARTLHDWGGEATPAGAARARQLARAAIGDRDWATAAQPALDRLRVARRDALTEIAIRMSGARDAEDLYGVLLIDALMGPASLTSRLRQAISAVQLFINRIVLGLEATVRADAVDPGQWEWMRNYRVWEANRKVLLYPENWIEPDLRTDQTAPFRALTAALTQDDTTGEAAETALRTYLDGLAEIGALEVAAMCNEYSSDNALTVTHVFGRTRSEPYEYHYRRFTRYHPADRLDASGAWTAWEPLPVEVTGEHLVPFLWQGKLFALWPVFDERSTPPAQPAAGGGNEPPVKYVTLRFAWSERRHGVWRAPRRFTGDALLRLRLSSAEWRPQDFYIRCDPQGKATAISVYLMPGIVSRSDNIASQITLGTKPVAVLSFDGAQLTQVLDWLRYRQGLSTVDTFAVGTSAPGDIPITLDSTTQVTARRGMSVPGSAGPFALPYGASTVPVLKQAPRDFRALPAPDEPALAFRAPLPFLPTAGRPLPFAYRDSRRQFFYYPTDQLVLRVSSGPPFIIWSEEHPQMHATALDLPHLHRFQATLSAGGVDALLDPQTQYEPAAPTGILGSYATDYGPDPAVVVTQPADDVSFDPAEPAGPYHWELFFHVALAAAGALTRNNRFAEARQWLHYIFDPTDTSATPSPARYWRFRPFRESGAGPTVADLVRRLTDPADTSPEKRAFLATIAEWRLTPFEPHVVARLRPRSYMYTVVMKYLDNLIAWADQLFRRESMEALDEATQLYVLAAQILGRRPESITRRTRPIARSYAELRPDMAGDAGALGTPLVLAENVAGAGGAAPGPGVPLPKTLYFAVPGNPKLADYHDLVEDRLFKLRHSMTIDGVVRQLPLFEPPIDPALLVRARAAGVDLAAALGDAGAPLPLYRFTAIVRTATELAGQTRELGTALLAAMEKRDGETLARLRNEHERALLSSVRQIRQLEIEEAKATLDALGPALENAQGRLAHYVGLLSQMEDLSIPGGPAGPTIASMAAAALETVTSTIDLTSTLVPMDAISAAATTLLKQALTRAADLISPNLPESTAAVKVPMNAAEKRHLDELKSARDDQNRAANQKGGARMLAMLPDFTVGTSGTMGSPVVTAQLGGSLLSKAAELFAAASDGSAAEHSYRANMASVLGSHQRRAADWVQQAQLAGRDIDQLTKQIAAATLRAAIAGQALRNHDQQAADAEAVDEFLRSKFTGEELYAWLGQQAVAVHTRAYQLAYDMAKRAEQAYRHELGLDASDFIRFGYWDGLRRGLAAGDYLLHDIKRLEAAYLSANRRELEILKHVSLRQLDPGALIRLRAGGTCEFEVPEEMFDLDFPGHYFRRIKTVALSVPCVVGPYTAVNATLTLLSSAVRTRNVVSGDYADPANRAVSRVPIQSVVTSAGQNDSGLFEVALHDERYLPFEGAGAVSRWRLSLPKDFRAFDYGTISDVIVHLRYTARDGGGTLADQAVSTLGNRLSALTRAQSTEIGLVQLIDVRADFGGEWRRFRDEGADLSLKLDDRLFPYLFRNRVSVQRVALVWEGDAAGIGLTASGDDPPAYESAWSEDSPALAATQPYLLVTYTI